MAERHSPEPQVTPGDLREASGARSARGGARVMPALSPAALKCRKKFLCYFPGGFADETYYDWERGYKWEAHQRWHELLAPKDFATLLKRKKYDEISAHVVKVESRTNLLFSFEKMALRDALKAVAGAKAFATGLHDFLYGSDTMQQRFERWRDVVGGLPRKQTRVLTWPLLTVFGFIAEPKQHIFLKPNVTRRAAAAYGFDFKYRSRPEWSTYASLLEFADTIRQEQRDLKPKDMMDLQGFIWVQGSDEYD